MPSAIVTTTYRYKRPPRKRKAALLEGPAIVKGKAEKGVHQMLTLGDQLGRHAQPGNDNRLAKQPVPIVTAKKPSGRKVAWTDDGSETPPEIKALIKRIMLGRGPGSST